jgi:hypothetical protein
VAHLAGHSPWKRRLALLSLALCSLAARADEKIEPIDAEFLEYLAELEGAEDDWTVVEREEPRKKAAAAKPSEPPKAQAKTAKPAADERSEER